MSHLLFSWGVEPLTGGQPERRTLAGSPPQCRSMQWNTCIHIRKHREYKTVFQLHLPASAPWCNFVFLHLFREAVVSPECTFQLTLHQTGLYPVTYVPSSFNTSRNQTKISHALFPCSDLQHGHPNAGLSRYGYSDVQRGEDTCRHAWPGRHCCLQCLCPGVHPGDPRRIERWLIFEPGRQRHFPG